jgi:hypothetical protein
MQKEAFDKIQHPLVIKTINNIEGMYLNIIKMTDGKPIAGIILSSVPFNIRKKLRMSLLTISNQYGTRNTHQSNYTRKINKGHPN